MLHELRIENIAVIEQLSVNFKAGLNVMTGETGAGKSVLIDSIAVVTGARAGRELVRTGADHATVTAVFDRTGTETWLEENDIESDEEELILQRRIGTDGKSRCRICGYPVSASQLKTLGQLLLEIHGQNDGLQLLDERRHLAALDRFADLDPEPYQKAYRKLCALQEERERLMMDETEKARLEEQLRDTIEELEKADVHEGELEELSARRDLLRNSEKLTEALHGARDALSGDQGALSAAQDAAWQASRAASYTSELRDAAEKLNQAVFMLTDAEELLADFEDGLDFSPEEYDRIEQRLRDLSRFERKYRKTADELPDYLRTCRERLEEISFSEERLDRLGREIIAQEKQCRELAADLHRKRTDAGVKLAERIETELRELSMPDGRFVTEIEEREELSSTGTDAVRFLLSANRGEPPGRISRIASGGELSRIMLAMKNVLAERDPVLTMVFDEIDTGVSGIAAQRVGEKLARLSGRKQVLCVTHLPQIAAMADAHYVIQKEERKGRTVTDIRMLDRSGKQQEIARLYGGDHITETTLHSAEEQLQYAEQFKNKMEEKENNGSV